MEISYADTKNVYWLSMFGIINTKLFNKDSSISQKDRAPFLVPDNKAEICFKCLSKFSLTFRRHHCYLCGNVFCKNCTSKNIHINNKNSIKVCDYCYQMTTEFNYLMKENICIDKSLMNFETKLNSFCRTYYPIKKKNEQFSKFINQNYEESIKQDSNSNYGNLLKILVKNILFKHLEEKEANEWYLVIYLLVKQAINNIRPSYRFLKDSLNINEFIKIKTIPFKDKSLCQVIEGFAMQKNVCSKKMRTEIRNPKIMLLNCELSANREDNKEGFDFSIEPIYLSIVKRKIEELKPNLILVNKSVSHYLLEQLFNCGISLVMNVKKSSLNKIARCTQTILLPSIDLIGDKLIMGQCSSFKIEKIKNHSPNNINSVVSNEYNLMLFEGCDELLFSTILISGENIDTLKTIKKLLKEIILPTARDFFLQMHAMYIFNMVPYKEEEITNESSLFTSEKNNFVKGFDTSLIIPTDPSSIEISFIKLTMYKEDKDTMANLTIKEDDNIETTMNADELKVQSSINHICEDPLEISLRLYSTDPLYDKPLGKLILDLCKQSYGICPTCGKKFINHLYYFYGKKGKLTMGIASLKDNAHDKVLNYLYKETGINYLEVEEADKKGEDDYDSEVNTNIYTYGYCKICKAIVTPLLKMPNELFNYSSTKFFTDMFRHHYCMNNSERSEYNIKSLCNDKCQHFIHKDIDRIFVTKYGSWKFEYEDLIKYIIVPMNMNNSNLVSYEKIKNDYLIEACDYSIEITSMLIEFLKEKEFKLNQEHLPSEYKCTCLSYEIFFDAKTKITKCINDMIISINSFKENIILKYLTIDNKNEEIVSKLQLYIQAIVYIKQIYLKVFEYKIITNQLESCIDKLMRYTYSILVSQSVNDEFFAMIQKTFKNLNLEVDNHLDPNTKELQDITFINEIDLESNETYNKVLKKLRYHDDEHTLYTNAVNDDDLSSIISYALTSNLYIDFMKSNNKFNLIDITTERNLPLKENEEEKENKADEALFDTLLLFDQNKQKFSHPQVTHDQILQILENELLSDEREYFHFTLKNDYTKNTLLYLDPEIEKVVNKKYEEKKLRATISFNQKKVGTLDKHSMFRSTAPMIKSNNKKNLIHSNNHIYPDFEEFEHNILLLNEMTNTIKHELKKFKDDNLLKNNILKKDLNAFVPKKKKEHIESSLLTTSFPDYEVIVYFPRQFEALRIAYCTTFKEFILSLSKSKEWRDNSGGKSKANFYKSIDSKYILKSVNKFEFKMFISSSSQYFHHNAKYLFHKMPSALAKILGAYKIKRKPNGNKKETKHYIILMENIFYGFDKEIRAYDLKGSRINRYIPKSKQKKPNQVLPDTNFKEDFNSQPIPIDKKVFDLLKAALHNDSLILNKMNVVDYSLLLLIDENKKDNKYIKLGIIDYIRKYTWDKQLEHLGKGLIKGFANPTIIKPEDYRRRFVKELTSCFIGI